MIYQGNNIFALSLHAFHKSSDNGTSWQSIPIDLQETATASTGEPQKIDVVKNGLYSFDIDQDKIWISCRNGIIVSDNLDGNFSWSYYSDDSTPRSIDMVNGYGWFVDSRSLKKKTPDKKEWTPVSPNTWWGFGSIITDPSDPANVAYFLTGSWMMTINGGKDWNYFSLPDNLIGRGYGLNIIGNDKTYIFRGPQYSDDHFKTWKPLGITADYVMNVGNEFYTFGTSTGQKDNKQHFFTGTPNNWIDHGSVDLDFSNRVTPIATNSMFFGYTTNGNFYRGTWE